VSLSATSSIVQVVDAGLTPAMQQLHNPFVASLLELNVTTLADWHALTQSQRDSLPVGLRIVVDAALQLRKGA
jgi:hypothetical protein